MADKYEAFVHYGPYDKDTIDAMYNIRFCGMPVSFLLLDTRKTNTFCHLCSSLLTLVIPNSKRVEGKLVVLDGEEHSWVEVDDVVYDTTEGLIWDKESYYEKDGVLSSKIVSDEEVHEEADKYLSENGFVESFIVWVEDLENNLDKNIYRTFLRDHIDRFMEEVNYDSFEVDPDELEKVRGSLNALYDEISTFVENHPIKYKKKESE